MSCSWHRAAAAMKGRPRQGDGRISPPLLVFAKLAGVVA